MSSMYRQRTNKSIKMSSWDTWDVPTVCEMAQETGWDQVQHNTASRVLGFRRGKERVNVYYTQRTVGTCLNHPRQGKTQLLRRNQDLDDLARIFVNPRVHTGAGYHHVHSATRPVPSVTSSSGGFRVWLNSRKDKKQFLRSISWETSSVVALAEGYLALEGHPNSRAWWGVGLTKTLADKLRGRQCSLPPAEYVALGDDDRYSVQFCDGSMQWRGGSELLTEKLQGKGKMVDVLAFAPDGGWFVTWEDESWSCQGLPRGLFNQINGRQKSLPWIEDLSCGPNGEWFVRYADTSWRANGLSDSLDNAIDELEEEGKKVISIAFGEDWTWVLKYGDQ